MVNSGGAWPERAQAGPLILVAGPTGAGKSRAALALAREFNGSVINIDSRQIYRDFPIITAQPAIEEQRQAPHLLYGFLDCRAKMTAGAYARLAAEALAQCRAEGRLPILVGGTGLYIQALLDGIADIPAVPEDISRYWQGRLRAAGPQALHVELARLDPDYAVKIHSRDSQRISRALEVCTATGKAFSWWHKQAAGAPLAKGPVLRLGVGLPLNELAARLEQRIAQMLEQGAAEEARQALDSCADRNAPGWSGIGCAELFAFVQGEMDLSETMELWLRNTRAYAKRQITWFKKDTRLTWFSPDQADEIIHAARQFLTSREGA